MALLALVLLLAASVVGVASAQPRPCGDALPTGPVVPQPVVFKNSCGSFLLKRDGQVSRRPAERFAGGGTGRKYGADLRIVRTRPGAYILRRQGGVVWRSSGLYRNDGGSIAFGPHAFAFASYRRGIFLTDLQSPERLVVPGTGLYPLAFRRDGSLLVVEEGEDPSIRVVSRQGSVLRRYRFRPRNGYAYDQRTESLLLVTWRRILVRVDGDAVRVVRPLGRVDGRLSVLEGRLTFSDFAHRGASDEIRYFVLRRDGQLVSRFDFRSPKGSRVDMGPVASPGWRSFAFRTVQHRPRPVVTVWLLRHGAARATEAFRHAGRQVGCGVGVSFGWHGRHVLYSATDGPAVIFDTHGGGVRYLSTVANLLPRRWQGERPTVHWLRDVSHG